MSKHFIVLTLTLIISIMAIVFSRHIPEPARKSSPMNHGLPWQIDLINGHSRVFGLSPGITTLAEAISIISREYELAILSRYQQKGALELFYNNFKAGTLQGKLLLVVDTDSTTLENLKSAAIRQEHLENGTKKFTLSQEQQFAIQYYRIRSVTFAPTVHLDQQMIEQHFGPARLSIITGKYVVHYLYPNFGVDILVNKKGNDLLQYVPPGDFLALQRDIRQQNIEYLEQQSTQ